MRFSLSCANMWNSIKIFFQQHARSHKLVYPGTVSRTLPIPDHIQRPDYSWKTLKEQRKCSAIEIKNQQQIAHMKMAGSVARHVLNLAKSHVQPGVTTEAIDRLVHEEILSNGAYPSPLHYKGFPKSCCTSVNNVVCHGIPDDRQLSNGDIINVDVTVYYKGCHGDTSDTFAVGEIDDSAKHLIATTQECLRLAIKNCAPGASFKVIGELIEDHAAKNGFSVCRDYIGHGIGSYFHGPPNVWHVRTPRTEQRLMESGMTFTIEPILIEGSAKTKVLADGWTVVTKDGSRSAQAEHTVLVTDLGSAILT
ncbi:unnamed protein product [Clavelina lepadiformis]|uniref:Methionine aminopeptidase n=1 Tax=Clavelina lepadiformis TaxID=159417 RepID=A0ABP0FK81_CLALP